jgi:hypothetical protein
MEHNHKTVAMHLGDQLIVSLPIQDKQDAWQVIEVPEPLSYKGRGVRETSRDGSMQIFRMDAFRVGEGRIQACHPSPACDATARDVFLAYVKVST